jgi:NitT/TauT family transport system substrate-binding protein
MRLLLAIALVSFFALPNQAPVLAQSLIRINAAYSSISSDQVGLYVAQEAGLFRKYGLETHFIYVAGAPRVIQSILAGDIQLGVAGGSALVSAVLGGADLVAAAAIVNIAPFYLVARPEVQTLQDLRGRPVGVTRYGSSTDFTLRFILRRAGLEPEKDVPILQMGGQSELAAAMEKGHIVATASSPPSMTKMQRAGAKILLTPKTIALRSPFGSLVARRNFLATQRDVVKNFIRGYTEGLALLARDKEGSKKAIARYLRSDDAEMLESSWQFANEILERIPYLDPEGIKSVLEQLSRTRPEAIKAQPETFIDNSLVAELEKEGFFRKIYAR